MRLATEIIIGFLVSAVLTCINTDKVSAVEIKRSEGIQARWVTDALRKYLAFELVDNVVKVKGDVRNPSFKKSRESAYIEPGDSIEGTPDRHAKLLVVLLSVSGQTAKFRYEAEFDTRSFGRDQIAIDTGEITIPFKELLPRTFLTKNYEPYLSKIQKRLSQSGFKLRGTNHESFADEEFYTANFLSSPSSSVSKQESELPVPVMMKFCATESDCEVVCARLSKLLKGQRVPDHLFDDHYYFPFGAYVGKRDMLRKGRFLFITLFYNDTQRKLLQEACFAALKEPE